MGCLGKLKTFILFHKCRHCDDSTEFYYDTMSCVDCGFALVEREPNEWYVLAEGDDY